MYEYDEIYEQLEEKKITVGAQKNQESKKVRSLEIILLGLLKPQVKCLKGLL